MPASADCVIHPFDCANDAGLAVELSEAIATVLRHEPEFARVAVVPDTNVYGGKVTITGGAVSAIVTPKGFLSKGSNVMSGGANVVAGSGRETTVTHRASMANGFDKAMRTANVANIAAKIAQAAVQLGLNRKHTTKSIKGMANATLGFGISALVPFLGFLTMPITLIFFFVWLYRNSGRSPKAASTRTYIGLALATIGLVISISVFIAVQNSAAERRSYYNSGYYD